MQFAGPYLCSSRGDGRGYNKTSCSLAGEDLCSHDLPARQLVHGGLKAVALLQVAGLELRVAELAEPRPVDVRLRQRVAWNVSKAGSEGVFGDLLVCIYSNVRGMGQSTAAARGDHTQAVLTFIQEDQGWRQGLEVRPCSPPGAAEPRPPSPRAAPPRSACDRPTRRAPGSPVLFPAMAVSDARMRFSCCSSLSPSGLGTGASASSTSCCTPLPCRKSLRWWGRAKARDSDGDGECREGRRADGAQGGG